MHEFLEHDMMYVIRLDEVLWGSLLLALTLCVHGAVMVRTLGASTALMERTKEHRPRLVSMGILVFTALMIVSANLFEVCVWAVFFVWKEAQPNVFSAFYNALLNFTTLQAGYLPLRWRLLEGMLGVSGLLTFAWSTSILSSLAHEFMQDALADEERKRRSRLAVRK